MVSPYPCSPHWASSRLHAFSSFSLRILEADLWVLGCLRSSKDCSETLAWRSIKMGGWLERRVSTRVRAQRKGRDGRFMPGYLGTSHWANGLWGARRGCLLLVHCLCHSKVPTECLTTTRVAPSIKDRSSGASCIQTLFVPALEGPKSN